MFIKKTGYVINSSSRGICNEYMRFLKYAPWRHALMQLSYWHNHQVKITDSEASTLTSALDTKTIENNPHNNVVSKRVTYIYDSKVHCVNGQR